MSNAIDHEQLSVGVIGGGLAGGIAAQRLHQHGHQVTVFDKARGPGGRCSTRRGDGVTFDHGAQVFCPAGSVGMEILETWRDAGVIEPWAGRHAQVRDGRIVPADDRTRWVGVPGMNALVKHLLADLDVRFTQRITSISHADGAWLIRDTEDAPCGRFDRLVLGVPADQATPLLAEVEPELSARIGNLPMQPSWAVMLSTDEILDLPFDSAELTGHASLGWLARNSAKPGRPASPPECWVLAANQAWSIEHLEREPDFVAGALVDAFRTVCRDHGVHLGDTLQAHGHRWRYAFPGEFAGTPCLLNDGGTLACVGDWLLGNRIEHALESGLAAADAIAEIGVEP